MVARDFSVIVFSLLSASVFASHFRGGLIQWKPVDSNTVRIYVPFSSIDVNLFACPNLGIVIRLEYENFDTTDFPQLSRR